MIEMNENLAQLEIEWIWFGDSKNSLRNAPNTHTHIICPYIHTHTRIVKCHGMLEKNVYYTSDAKQFQP